MDRSNHYEAAFEAYLRDSRLGYVAVDETRRSSLDDEPVKSLDFIVHGLRGAKLLVDVKGRRFPGAQRQKMVHVWQNWSPQDDIDGLERWEQRFGEGYCSLLVFVYHILPVVDLAPGTPDLWHWRGQRYLMRAIPVAQYKKAMRVRSPRWKTVHLPGRIFRELVKPFREFAMNPAATAANRDGFEN
jgi:hypothetical protein